MKQLAARLVASEKAAAARESTLRRAGRVGTLSVSAASRAAQQLGKSRAVLRARGQTGQGASRRCRDADRETRRRRRKRLIERVEGVRGWYGERWRW